MARMYPQKPRFHSPGEKMLFERLQQELPAEMVVIHGLYWQRDKGQTEEETDFVIIHPDYGFLVCEVKSGYSLRFADGTVKVNDRDANPNPYQQARKGQRLLLAFLREVVAANAPAMHFAVARTVWLTARARDSFNLPRGYDAMTLTLEDALAGHIGPAIERQFARIVRPSPLTQVQIQHILRELWPMGTPRQTVARLLAGERRHFRHLHVEQMQVMTTLLESKRGDVIGGAGTGKTVVAYEIAARLADAGQRVLYVCTHRTQVHWLRGDMHYHLAFFLRQPHFAIVDIDDLMQHIIATAHHIAPDLVNVPRVAHARAKALRDSIALICKGAASGDVTPNLFIDTASPAAPLFDALLLDEAQDVAPELRLALVQLLADPANGRYYTFGDERQNEEHYLTHPTNAPLELQRNVRNARAIYELMHRIHPDLPDPATLPADHPQGLVEYRPLHLPGSATEDVRASAERQLLGDLLHELIDRQHVRPEQILIITCRTRDISKVSGKQSVIFHPRNHILNGIRLHQLNWRFEPGKVPVTTIQSAKGLESDIVILAETDGLAEGNVPQARVYIAISRARSRLYILSRKRPFDRNAFLTRPAAPPSQPRKPKRKKPKRR